VVDEDKRLATDILLSIEAKLMTLDKRIQNSEYLLKSLLSKANSASSSVTKSTPPRAPQTDFQSDVINKDNFENRQRTNRFSEIAANQGVDLDNTFIARPSDMEPGEMIESSLRAPSRGQRGPKPKGPKASVSQTLSNGNNPLFLASIEVLDSNDELVSQTRTNPKGRWLMALTPGDYQVHVVKRFPPDSGKSSIDTTYQISVPVSDKPVELDPYSVG